MEEPRQTLQADEEVTLVVSGEEATLVSPRFDDEEALVARPVVPLDGEAVEEPAAAAAEMPARRPERTLRAYAPRRSWVLALVLVSVLVGGVLGGAGLYLYQRQSQGDVGGASAGAAPQAETPPAIPAETQQPLNAGAENAPAPEAQAPTEGTASDAPTAEAPTAAARPAEPAADGASSDGAATSIPARAPAPAPAAARRDGAETGGSAGTPRRGKKGEQDDEGDRSDRRRSRPDSVVPVARDDAGAREARRVDSIVYRPRRAPRRERLRRDTAGDTDRLRRIFEGTPE